MRTYTLTEVSKMINVSTSKIKQWEKDFMELLVIPRSKQGARLYTNVEIKILKEIQQLFINHFSLQAIKDILQRKELEDTHSIISEIPMNIVSEEQILNNPFQANVLSQKNTENFYITMDKYKVTFLNEVKNEIKNVLQKEVLNEIKKELSEGSLNTIHTLSDTINKSNEDTQAKIIELSISMDRVKDLSSKTYKSLEKRITNQSFETSEEFYSISMQLSKTSEELSHYLDATNSGIFNLTENIEKEREYYMEERKQLRHEISQREAAFQSMLTGFREASAAKEKKWWKFW